MREINTHSVLPKDEPLTITVADKAGQGGANHQYIVSWNGINKDLQGTQRSYYQSCYVGFQDGPIKEFGVNGVTNEALLAIVRDRLECFQAGPFASTDNETALNHVRFAMDALHKRTRDRLARNVEGTNQK